MAARDYYGDVPSGAGGAHGQQGQYGGNAPPPYGQYNPSPGPYGVPPQGPPVENKENPYGYPAVPDYQQGHSTHTSPALHQQHPGGQAPNPVIPGSEHDSGTADRGLGSTLLGGVVGHKLGHGILGTVGGAILGHVHHEKKKEKKEGKEGGKKHKKHGSKHRSHSRGGGHSRSNSGGSSESDSDHSH